MVVDGDAQLFPSKAGCSVSGVMACFVLLAIAGRPDRETDRRSKSHRKRPKTVFGDAKLSAATCMFKMTE